VIVQIYGITTPDDAALINASGADHAGVVLDEGIDTWDSVDRPTLRSILDEFTAVRIVALSLSSEPDRIRRTVDIVAPAVVHLARAVGEIEPAELADLRSRVAPVEVMTTVPVLGPECIDVALAYAPVSDYLLLDSRDPSSGIVGATGLTHDWALSRRVVEAVDVPVVLAGGLGPDNVGDAIAAVGPAGVDSETHTSRTDDRRRKDADRVARFVTAAHGAGLTVA
jgi:phosphoribosylanthranilate isomerase